MSAAVQAILGKMLAPLQRRMRSMVARAIVELVDDGKKLQMLQVTIQADVQRDNVERFQQFGFSSVPAPGAEAVVLGVGANSDHYVAVSVDDRSCRPTSLEEGESGLYTKQDGFRVRNKANGEVHLAAGEQDLADSKLLALAELVKNEISALRSTVNTNVTIFNAMTLPSGMGPVGPPPVQMQAPAAVGDVKCTKVKAL